MLIELLGLPGAGKSTLIRALLPALRAQGVTARRGDKLAGLPCVERHAPRYLERGVDRTTMYRVTQFRQAHRGLMKHLEYKLALSPPDEFLFTLTAGLYQVCREYGDAVGVALMDEGFVHRGVAAHLDQPEALFERYLGMAPVPDMVLHLAPSVDVAFERAVARRAHKGEAEKVLSKLGGRDLFARRHAMLRLGVEVMRARGAKVVVLDTSDEIGRCVQQILPPVLARAQPVIAAQ